MKSERRQASRRFFFFFFLQALKMEFPLGALRSVTCLPVSVTIPTAHVAHRHDAKLRALETRA